MKWLARSLMRRVITIVVFAAIAGYIATGSVGSVASAATNVLGDVPKMLGISGVVDSLGKALEGSAGGQGKKSKAIVSHTVDGDTLDVQFKNGTERSVRLIGLDTPEKYRGPVECGAPEASAFTRKITEGKPVKLTTDPTQDSVDRYDRLLRYAKVNGKDVAVRVIRAGWAAPYVYDSSSPPQNTDRYRAAAEKAKAEGRGVWGMCGGNFHSNDDEPWSGD